MPRQLLVWASKARNNVTALPHDTSLLDVRASIPEDKNIEVKDKLRIFSLPAALIACAPGSFKRSATDMRAALSMVRDASEVLDRLLEGGHSTIAGRLADAFRNIGSDRIADDIVKTMRMAGYDVRESDLFETQIPAILQVREKSPYVNRIRLMWQEMRKPILARFPGAPGLPKDTKAYLKRVEDVYVTDAYHSLSIGRLSRESRTNRARAQRQLEPGRRER